MSSYIKRIYYHTRLNFLDQEEKRSSQRIHLVLLNETNINKIVCGSFNMGMADVYERELKKKNSGKEHV